MKRKTYNQLHIVKHNSTSIAKTIVEKLQATGHVALFAGGAVRDLLLNIPCEDIDIATSAHPHQVMELFKKSIAVGAQFGVVVVIEEGHEFEIATFRSDTQYVDGRHPQTVHFTATMQEDAMRRDFTINGMMYDPCTNTIYDFVHGQEDVTNRRIKTIGSPYDRFNEDRLRMLRAIRFKNVLHFSMEQETWNALCDLAPTIVSSVSPERIWQELVKMHKKGALSTCMQDMVACNMFQYIFPKIHASQELLMLRIQAIHTYKGQSLIAALCLLYLPESPDSLRLLGIHMHLSKKELQCIEFCIHYCSGQTLSDEVALVHMYAAPECADFLQEMASLSKNPDLFLKEHKQKQAELAFWIEQLQRKKYFISSQDLLALGILPGKEMGRMLKKVFERSLRQRMTKKDEILHTLLDD